MHRRNEDQAPQPQILSRACARNQKNYQLACISTHLDRIIERDKGNIPEPSDFERKDASLDHAVRDLEN